MWRSDFGFRGLTVGALVVVLQVAASAARGEESPYCRKVRARAASEAALLLSPELLAQGIRFPSSPIDLGPTVGAGYQVRVGLSFSPTDLHKGLRVIRVGEADCARYESSDALERLLEPAADGARLAALREKAAFLRARRAEWQALVVRAEARHSERAITLVELEELRQRASGLEAALVEAEGESERLAVRAPEPPALSRPALVQQLIERTMVLEREASYLRTLDGVGLRLSGGVIPQPGVVDWFGLVELRLNPGGLVRAAQERRYLEARQEELLHAWNEPPELVRRLRDEVGAAQQQARRQAELTGQRLATFERALALLEDSSAPRSAHTRDAVALDVLGILAERIYLERLAASLSELL